MSERQKVLLSSISILCLSCCVVAALAVGLLYHAAFNQERMRLIEVVQSQAQIIEAVARFDAEHSRNYPGGSFAATLDQIRDAHNRYEGFGRTGEIALARRDGDAILFVLSHQRNQVSQPEPIPFSSHLAEPMRRALSGQSGWVVGPDYRGMTVLAAYEPVEELGLGIVAKTDLAEIREPFILAGMYAAAVLLLTVAAGSILFLLTTNPLIKRVERSEALYRAIVQDQTEIIRRFLPEGTLTFANDAHCRFIGKTREELLGARWQPSVHSEDAHKIQAGVNSLSLASPVVSFEYRAFSGSGELHWMQSIYRGFFDRQGKLTEIQAVGRNITKLKQVEEELREARDRLEATVQERTADLRATNEALERSERLLRQMLDTLPVGVWIADQHGRIILGNPAVQEIWSGAKYVDIGEYHEYKGWWADTGEPIAAEEWAMARAISKGETSLNEVVEIECFDGTHKIILNSGVPIRNNDGEIVGAIVTNQDITEKRRTDEALKEYSYRLEEMVDQRTRELRDAQEQLVRTERLAVLGQLAGGVGHELRNPLGAIKNAVYFLNMVFEEPDPELKEILQIMDKEIARSEKIISSLLDFARPKMPERTQVQVNEVIREMLPGLNVPESIEVKTYLDGSLSAVSADPDQLRQVFGNLARNALQAMKDSGSLIIKSEPKAPDRIEVSFADSGTGISEEAIGKLFEPLFTTKAKGIGLGLTVAKTIVEKHGGTIHVESEAGRGSTFRVQLPVGTTEQQ